MSDQQTVPVPSDAVIYQPTKLQRKAEERAEYAAYMAELSARRAEGAVQKIAARVDAIVARRKANPKKKRGFFGRVFHRIGNVFRNLWKGVRWVWNGIGKLLGINRSKPSGPPRSVAAAQVSMLTAALVTVGAGEPRKPFIKAREARAHDFWARVNELVENLREKFEEEIVKPKRIVAERILKSEPVTEVAEPEPEFNPNAVDEHVELIHSEAEVAAAGVDEEEPDFMKDMVGPLDAPVELSAYERSKLADTELMSKVVKNRTGMTVEDVARGLSLKALETRTNKRPKTETSYWFARFKTFTYWQAGEDVSDAHAVYRRIKSSFELSSQFGDDSVPLAERRNRASKAYNWGKVRDGVNHELAAISHMRVDQPVAD